MKNYEYIISSLPALSLGWNFPGGASFDSYVDWIRSQLDKKDKQALDKLLAGYKDENLVPGFYQDALSDSEPFIREFFAFDLNVRNAKARFLNKAFDRPLDQDTIALDAGDFPEAEQLQGIFQSPDLLERERGLDGLFWDKISRMTVFNYFDLSAVLAFVAKLHIIGRWFALDEESGRRMFLSLVEEVRGTFKGVEFNA